MSEWPKGDFGKGPRGRRDIVIEKMLSSIACVSDMLSRIKRFMTYGGCGEALVFPMAWSLPNGVMMQRRKTFSASACPLYDSSFL